MIQPVLEHFQSHRVLALGIRLSVLPHKVVALRDHLVAHFQVEVTRSDRLCCLSYLRLCSRKGALLVNIHSRAAPCLVNA